MKQVVAVVRPFLAEKILEALRLAPVEALSVREVKGYSRQKSYLDQYGDNSEYSVAFLPKVEISLWVDDARVEELVRKIVSTARTGRMGDGKIFVLPIASHAGVIDIASYAPASTSPAPSAAPAKNGDKKRGAESGKREGKKGSKGS